MIFLDHHFIFLLYFFYWLYTLKMAPNQRKTDFLQNRWFLAIFRVLKIASKDIVCTLKTHKVFVCTMSKIVLYVQFYFLRISSPNPFVTFKLFLASFVLMECFVLLYVIRFFNFLGCNSVMVKILNLYLVYFFEVC